jgi:hypothetical protein
MSTQIIWTVTHLERQLSDGLVISANWTCEVSDGEVSTSQNGGVSFERGNSFIPYENLTHEQVVEWVKSKLGEYVSRLEATLQSDLNEIKTPITATGVPW